MIERVEKIAALKRELALRRNVFRRRIAEGKMPQANADYEIAVMEAILHDYIGQNPPSADHERDIT